MMIGKFTDYESQLYEKAKELSDFKILIPYRRPLTLWAVEHPEDLLIIATIGSHRCDRHNFCTTDGHHGSNFSPEKCAEIQKLIDDATISKDTNLFLDTPQH